MTISLPVQSTDTASHPILILDDESAVLHSLRETLERFGYTILVSQSPLEALEIVRDHSLSVILSDMRMPEMNGLDFLQHCEAIRPEATRVLITAMLSFSSVLKAMNSGAIFRFIPKPWEHAELLAAVKDALAHFQLVTRSGQLADEVTRLQAEGESLRRALAEKTHSLEMLQRTFGAAVD